MSVKYIDHEYTYEIVCPHCGYSISDSNELSDDCGIEEKCEQCGKPYSWERIVSVSYCTEKKELELCECCKESRVLEKISKFSQPKDTNYSKVCEDCTRKLRIQSIKERIEAKKENKNKKE